jgi:hypothetical protein|uniref:Uncharacterized protein n=1 Tax=Siphoviridae sp. ctHip2 TaxID=2827830 RepID=A0A8S5RWF2_9CAUD|nr:MAG TPA: hypothetical protein [Siphoviridae sp. ctHip2]
MTKTIKGFIKTFNKHELGKEYSKTNSYLADAIRFELKDVYNAGSDYSIIYPYIYEVEANVEDVWNISKGQTWLPDYFQTTKAVAVREVSYLELVQAIDLTSSTKEKFEKIYNGDLTKEEFETTWASLTKRSFEALGHNQRFLYIACLSQDKYELTKPEKELSETTLMLHAKYGKLFNKDLRVSSKVKMNIATENEIINALETDLFDVPNILENLVETENYDFDFVLKLLKESNYLIFNKLTTAYGYNTGRWEFDKIDTNRAKAESYLNPIKAFNDYKDHEELILKGLLLNNFLIKGADYSEFESILKIKEELEVELKTL